MPALSRSQASNCANPVLDLFIAVSGVLTDLSQLEFQVFEKVTGPTPVQVYPPSGRQAVNVTDPCPAGQRIGTGHYVAVYTPPPTEPLGTHELRWFFRLTPTSPEQSFIEEFEVLASPLPATSIGYCTLQDLRNEGVPLTYSDDRCLRAIDLASRDVDRYTGRFFEPRELTVTLDGEDGACLFFEHPIIAVAAVALDGEPVDPADFVIYNRHLTENLLDPDDRANPRIEVYQPRPESIYWREMRGRGVWPRGQRNVSVEGVFGYTEFDGSSQGRTPAAIRYATTLMSMRYLGGAWAAFQNPTPVGGIKSIKTRDQQIDYGDPHAASVGRQGIGPLTGDPAIDRILLQHRRPIRLALV